ncbi:MAG: protein kinase [Ignavibacteria bacterium]|jgi:serine/threonine-protein kinase|nr:protein kinase [Ignavibacteria bacterium]MCU7505051.1 protein kinase [Ignavibacteria bacterium]MCU7515309.1 protein kinase [Ignavibacteria bacterium]
MIGRVINNYKIISELGQGGMGIVYKAYDSKLDRYVAIKILKSQVVKNSRFKERFEKEAKNQAKLSHQNIVTVYGFLEEDGLLGIIMEYVEGQTLESLIESRGRLELDEAIPIIKQVLKAAAYAHSKKFVHRDIKPSNIIINQDGVSKLMDFGISKSILDRNMTSPGRNVGTLLYMSPEQITGEESVLESDIYSIGVTFFEMLTGLPPFNFETEQEITEGHLKKDPPDLLSLRPELPVKAAGIIKKALSKKPAGRFSSCDEFISELEALEAESSDYRNFGPPDSKIRNTKGYKFKAIFYSFLIVVSLLGIIYFSFTQVLELWKSGQNPLAPALSGGKKEQMLIPGFTQGKFENFTWSVLNSSLKNDLNSIFFVNDSMGFCCGNEGTVLKTVDSGVKWVKLRVPADKNLFDIAFTQTGTGFAVGENGCLLKTTDYGVSWLNVDLKSQDVLLRIKFISSSTGFILGSRGTVFRTLDQGENWSRVDIASSNTLFDLDFPDEKTGIIVGWNGECFRTLDKGASWEKRPQFTSNYLRAVKFINGKTGFSAGGNGEVFKTDNAGMDWRKVTASLNSGFSDIEFIDDRIGVIVGRQGKILLTSDSGNSWKEAKTNVFTALNRIELTSGKKVYAVGVNGTIVKF